MNDIEVKKKKQLSEIEASKFEQFIKAVGPETLVAISEAPDDLKTKLMATLGFKQLLGDKGGLLGGLM